MKPEITLTENMNVTFIEGKHGGLKFIMEVKRPACDIVHWKVMLINITVAKGMNLYPLSNSDYIDLFIKIMEATCNA